MSWTVVTSCFSTSAGFVVALSTRCASQTPAVGDRRSQIDRLMTRLHDQHLFTGEILVAEKGIVIYEGAFGLGDRTHGPALHD